MSRICSSAELEDLHDTFYLSLIEQKTKLDLTWDIS